MAGDVASRFLQGMRAGYTGVPQSQRDDERMQRQQALQGQKMQQARLAQMMAQETDAKNMNHLKMNAKYIGGLHNVLQEQGWDAVGPAMQTTMKQFEQFGIPIKGLQQIDSPEALTAAYQVSSQLFGDELTAAPKTQIVDGQLVTIDPRTGTAAASNIPGLDRSGSAQDRELRSRQIAVSEEAEKRQAGKLSAGLEKALLAAQDSTVTAQRSANKYTNLANDFTRLGIEGGLKTTFGETLKGILGTQDDVTEFRREFNKVRLSEGLKNLPPGPATDRDVQEAFKGVPPANAPAEQVSSFLRGAARLARFDAGYNQFKADFISDKRTAAGINKEWRRSVFSPALGREVSMAEIYESAQNRSTTPEDIKKQLGID